MTRLWSLGATLYQMLTGVHPIDADDYMEIMIKHLKDEPGQPTREALDRVLELFRSKLLLPV